jgi:hypothetical protein
MCATQASQGGRCLVGLFVLYHGMVEIGHQIMLNDYSLIFYIPGSKQFLQVEPLLQIDFNTLRFLKTLN